MRRKVKRSLTFLITLVMVMSLTLGNGFSVIAEETEISGMGSAETQEALTELFVESKTEADQEEGQEETLVPQYEEGETNVPEAETSMPEISWEETEAEISTEAVTEENVQTEENYQTEELTEGNSENIGESELETELDTDLTVAESETEEQDTEEEAKPEFTYNITVDGINVDIYAPEGILPEGTTVNVTPLSPEVIDTAAQDINNTLEEKEVVQIIGFDITFFDGNGNEMHSLDGKVSIRYSGMEIVEEAEAAQVYHADENGNITNTLTEVSVPSESVGFTSDNFSPVLYVAYSDGIMPLAAEEVSLKPGESKTVKNDWYWGDYTHSSNPDVATVSKSGKQAVITANANATPGSTATVTFGSDSWLGTRYTYNVTIVDPKGVNEGAQVYYLLSPTSNPDSNATSQWGPNAGNAVVNTTGAIWTDNKNAFAKNQNIAQYIISWPDGSVGDTWTLDKNAYQWVYEAIYKKYKDQLAEEIGVTDLKLEDIEEITLVPYKISKDNGTTPSKHIDCTVSVKCSKAYTAKFWVQEPNAEGYTNVYNKTYKIVSGSPEPIVEYTGVEQTKVIDGITYRFDGWYPESQEKPEDQKNKVEWNYTPISDELSDGTVNFYAKYVPAITDITIEKRVTGGLGDINKGFTFSYSYGSETGTFVLKNGETHTIKNVPIGTALTLTETDADGYAISAAYGKTSLQGISSGKAMSFEIIDTGNAENKIVVTNSKDVVPDTGVLLDTLPYILILVIVIIGAVLFFRKRRCRYDD